MNNKSMKEKYEQTLPEADPEIDSETPPLALQAMLKCMCHEFDWGFPEGLKDSVHN